MPGGVKEETPYSIFNYKIYRKGGERILFCEGMWMFDSRVELMWLLRYRFVLPFRTPLQLQILGNTSFDHLWWSQSNSYFQHITKQVSLNTSLFLLGQNGVLFHVLNLVLWQQIRYFKVMSKHPNFSNIRLVKKLIKQQKYRNQNLMNVI